METDLLLVKILVILNVSLIILIVLILMLIIYMLSYYLRRVLNEINNIRFYQHVLRDTPTIETYNETKPSCYNDVIYDDDEEDDELSDEIRDCNNNKVRKYSLNEPISSPQVIKKPLNYSSVPVCLYKNNNNNTNIPRDKYKLNDLDKHKNDLAKLFEKKTKPCIVKSQSYSTAAAAGAATSAVTSTPNDYDGHNYIERKEIKAKFIHKHMKRSKSWDINNQTYSNICSMYSKKYNLNCIEEKYYPEPIRSTIESIPTTSTLYRDVDDVF